MTIQKFTTEEMKTSSGDITKNALNSKLDEIQRKIDEVQGHLREISPQKIIGDAKFYQPTFEEIRAGISGFIGIFSAETIDEMNKFIEELNKLIESLNEIDD